MSYALGGSVQNTDLNSFTNTFNAFWGSGSGNSGYGQPQIPSVSYGDKVRANNYWRSLVQNIEATASHQGTSITAMTPTPTTAGKITFLSAVSSNLTTVNNNRLNAASSGSTSVSSSTSTQTWNDSMTVTFTVTFASNNAARYFFNAGGQIGFSFSHPATGGMNTLLSDICSEAGTVWVSSPTSGTVSISGTSYNGVTKVGGVSSIRQTVNTNYGFYAFNSTSTEIFRQTGDDAYGRYLYYLGTFLQIKASTNNAGVLTFVCVFDEIPDGMNVSSGTVSTLTLRPPSTTYISNSWGTPVVASNTEYISHGVVAFGDPVVNRSTGTRSGASYSWTVPNGINIITIAAAGGGGGSYAYHDGGYCQHAWAGGPGGGVLGLIVPVVPGDVISGVYGSGGGSGYYNGGLGGPGSATTIYKNGSLVATCGAGGQATGSAPGTTTIAPGYTGTPTVGGSQTVWLDACDGGYPYDNHYDPWSWVLGGSYPQSALGYVATQAPPVLGTNYQRAGMPQVCGWVAITY